MDTAITSKGFVAYCHNQSSFDAPFSRQQKSELEAWLAGYKQARSSFEFTLRFRPELTREQFLAAVIAGKYSDKESLRAFLLEKN